MAIVVSKWQRLIKDIQTDDSDAFNALDRAFNEHITNIYADSAVQCRL